MTYADISNRLLAMAREARVCGRLESAVQLESFANEVDMVSLDPDEGSINEGRNDAPIHAQDTHRRETGNLSTERLDRLVTIDELSSLLKTSKQTIYQWCHHRSIPYYQLGRRSLFDPVEVIEWLEAKRVEPVGGAQ